MKRALVLLAGVALCGPAWAAPKRLVPAAPQGLDILAYNENARVPIHGIVGKAQVVIVAPGETVTDVWGPDASSVLVALGGGQFILKPLAADAGEPLFAKVRRQDGTDRLYRFAYDAVAAGDQPNDIRFTDPAAAAKERAVKWQAIRAKREAKAAEIALQQTALPVRNLRYVGQGDWNLLPSRQVWDDGQSTFLSFPANSRVPSIYAIGPDGKETLVNTSVTGGIVMVHQTARMFRLRDGDAVLCVFNLGFDAVGVNPGTGTTSPDVVREVKQ